VLRARVRTAWQLAKQHDGVGEFGKILKRLYRLAALAGLRQLRQRALRDLLAEPTIAARVCNYVRVTGTAGEYRTFYHGLVVHPEQVYPDVSLAATEALLQMEATGSDAAAIVRLAKDLLRRRHQFVGENLAAGVAPLLLLRFGNRRTLNVLSAVFTKRHDPLGRPIVRSAAVVFASGGRGEFRAVRKAASTLWRNYLAEIVQLGERLGTLTGVPNSFKSRLRLGFDALTKYHYLDMRVLVMLRLLLLSRHAEVRQWVDDWRQQQATSLPHFDQRLLRRTLKP